MTQPRIISDERDALVFILGVTAGLIDDDRAPEVARRTALEAYDMLLPRAKELGADLHGVEERFEAIRQRTGL